MFVSHNRNYVVSILSIGDFTQFFQGYFIGSNNGPGATEATLKEISIKIMWICYEQ